VREEQPVKKSSEYREHAEECRVLARKAGSPDHQQQLLKMAETWEQLAIERQRLIAKHPELDIGGEREK
jgi:hypothetical protein